MKNVDKILDNGFIYIIKTDINYILWNKEKNIFIVGTWVGGQGNWHWDIQIVNRSFYV